MLQIETQRLILRELKIDDHDAVHAYASDPETTLHMDWGPNGDEETRAFLSSTVSNYSNSPRKCFSLAITLRSNHILIGTIGLEIESFQNRSASFGYILNKTQHRKGYTTEAGEALLAYAFKELGLHRIWATCRPDNTQSIRVLEKLHFQREGFLRDEKLIRGEYRHSLLFARLETDK